MTDIPLTFTLQPGETIRPLRDVDTAALDRMLGVLPEPDATLAPEAHTEDSMRPQGGQTDAHA